MRGRRTLVAITTLFILIISPLPVTASQFTEYEIDMLSGMVYEDCNYSTYLFVCENVEGDSFSGEEMDCIDEQVFAFWGPSRRMLLEDLLERGELLRYYNGERIGLNEIVDGWKGIHYEIGVDNISREEIIKYLQLHNNRAVGDVYAGKRKIYCYVDEERGQEKYFHADVSGQKFWGDDLIKEPDVSGIAVYTDVFLALLVVLVFIIWRRRR